MEDRKEKPKSVVLEIQNIVQETKTGIDQNPESKKGGNKLWDK